MRDLGRPGEDSDARGINNQGDVVGIIDLPFNATYPNHIAHAALWRHGKFTDLGLLGGSGSSIASAINDRGQIVGGSSTATSDGHAVLWDGDKIIDLGTLGGATSFAASINNRGQVVGISSTPIAFEVHGFLWEDDKMADLGTLGGNFTLPWKNQRVR